MSDRQEIVVVSEGNADQEFLFIDSDSNSAANQDLVRMKTLERYFNGRTDKEMGNNVDAVEDRIQNAFSTAIDCIITPKIELAIRSKNASSGQDSTSVMVNSDRNVGNT